MSSASEANSELGMKVNIDATRALLEALRKKAFPGSDSFIRLARLYTDSLRLKL